jgi:hypothetical protein
MCVYESVYEFECVCVCVFKCKRERESYRRKPLQTCSSRGPPSGGPTTLDDLNEGIMKEPRHSAQRQTA